MTFQETKALLNLAKKQDFKIVTFSDFVKFYKTTL